MASAKGIRIVNMAKKKYLLTKFNNRNNCYNKLSDAMTVLKEESSDVTSGRLSTMEFSFAHRIPDENVNARKDSTDDSLPYYSAEDNAEGISETDFG
jgi:hypothetical protein